MNRWLLVGVIVAASCSSSPSLSVYADAVESQLDRMVARIHAGEVLAEAEPTLANMHWALQERVAARQEFIDAFGALDPPGEVAELHDTTVDIITRLATAEAELADVAATLDGISAFGDVWETPEGRAALAVGAEAVALCKAAQTQLDATGQRERIGGVPWIPNEMKEIVDVVFECHQHRR